MRVTGKDPTDKESNVMKSLQLFIRVGDVIGQFEAMEQAVEGFNHCKRDDVNVHDVAVTSGIDGAGNKGWVVTIHYFVPKLATV